MNWIFWYAYLATSTSENDVKIVWNNQIQDMVKWLSNKGYETIFDKDVEDCVCFMKKKVYINSRSHPETKYYTLLHESGHVLIAQDSSKFEKEMPMYARSDDGRSARSKAYRVSTIAEELEAWKRGRRLAKRLTHHVDDMKYDKLITEGVMSYIEWAAEGGG